MGFLLINETECYIAILTVQGIISVVLSLFFSLDDPHRWAYVMAVHFFHTLGHSDMKMYKIFFLISSRQRTALMFPYFF